ncbi:hypothetical protein GJ744_010636 [Endocarpon pusillum]|uniref:Uncharacterized protein n=1 Tax=Endocarpon pusillum TaxID=364733 RepID=A0A8H7APU6_9EURO|nr:hypothetical protein GJ744_010636 [Endocarpon pusillum]
MAMLDFYTERKQEPSLSEPPETHGRRRRAESLRNKSRLRKRRRRRHGFRKGANAKACAICRGWNAMRIAFGEAGAGDKEVKTTVAASGRGRLNVAIFVVLVRCVVAGLGSGEMRLRSRRVSSQPFATYDHSGWKESLPSIPQQLECERLKRWLAWKNNIRLYPDRTGAAPKWVMTFLHRH